MDACLFGVSFWLAHLLRSHAEDFGPEFVAVLRWLGGTPVIEPFEAYFAIFLLVIPMSLVLLEAQGFYDRSLLASRRQTAWQLLKACSLVSLGVVLVMFLLKIQLARAVIVLFGVISFVLVMAKEFLYRRWVLTGAGRAELVKRLVLVGTLEDRVRLRNELREVGQGGLEVAAEVDVSDEGIDRLVHLLHEHSANGVLLSARHAFFGQVEKVIRACELEGVEVWLLADFFRTQISQTALDEFHGRPILVFRSAPEDSWQGVVKQVVDTVGAGCLLLAAAPVMGLCAALIKITSPGPVFFRQLRSGLNGRPFVMYKFRTMVSNAEQRRHELERLNEMAGPVFKVTNDPRVTPLGRWLRRYSLDELPQLFNVLRSEMSLVGPRPLPVDEVRRFDDLSHRRRLSVKPGLTCLWQVSGRNNVRSFNDWVRLDLEYIDNWSLWLDFKILLRTIPTVLSGAGAR
jgi:exopolysaccharide biosynthesis polyprenyl glycosylphosphotransferase